MGLDHWDSGNPAINFKGVQLTPDSHTRITYKQYFHLRNKGPITNPCLLDCKGSLKSDNFAKKLF